MKGWRFGADPKDINEAIESIDRSAQPIIYAGEGVFYSGAAAELKEFSELTQIPVLTSAKAKGVFPENHELSLMNGGRRGGGKLGSHFVKKADLVLALGASLTRGPGTPFHNGIEIIHSTINTMDVNLNYPTQHVLLGDAKIVLRQLIDEATKQGVTKSERKHTLVEEIKKVKENWIKEWLPKLTSNEEPINPYRLIWDLMNTVDRTNTIITPDAGWPRDSLAPFWETVTKRGYIGWGHHSTMGASLGFALGAKIANPDKLVINYIGDGSFGMVGMDFETAVREKIPILTIMTNNIGLGHYYDDVPEVAYLGGEYYKVAQGLGGYGERIESPENIIPAIKRGINSVESGKPALLEFMTSREHEMNSKYWVNT